MTYEQLLAHYRTQKAAGDAIGVAQSTVAGWKELGIPHPRQAQYEVITARKLKADRSAFPPAAEARP
jgi:hypothetical protein